MWDEILKRIGRVGLNWILLITAPLWAPVHVWIFVATGKECRAYLINGKGLIIE